MLRLLLLVALAPPPALIVTIRDASGAPLAGVRVTVLDRAGQTALARLTTDASGQASVATLPAGEVRVAVSGQLAGAPLRQTGEDATGALVILGAPPTTLALVVSGDGLVAPDPAVMVAPDVGITITTALPTAAPASTATPAAPTPHPTATPLPAGPHAAGAENSWLILLGIVLAAALTLACGILPLSLGRGGQR